MSFNSIPSFSMSRIEDRDHATIEELKLKVKELSDTVDKLENEIWLRDSVIFPKWREHLEESEEGGQ